jgi:NCS1 family nucleobase:cation symporter-1
VKGDADRVELAPDQEAELAGNAALYNHDLAPTHVSQRTWGAYNYCALWMGMAHCIPTWTMAAGFIALGLNWWQAILAIALGSSIVLMPILFNSHAGTKYGIPFPVLARASFGTTGANIPALLRALVAAGWFGINAYIGGQAVQVLFVRLFPGWETLDVTGFAGLGLGSWITFLFFWCLNLLIIYHGMEAVRRFEAWAGPAVIVLAAGLLIWCYGAAGGWGPILNQPSRLPSAAATWAVFATAVMAAVSFWATLSLNIPDFTRFARSQRDQWIGQTLGLPATMAFFSLFAVLITSASVVIFGQALWEPVLLIGRLSSTVAVVAALGGIIVATLSVNIAANIVSPAYDFANLWPRRIDFRRGGFITGVLGVLMMPWKLLANAQTYIYDWLGVYGVALGPIAGILIADYWLVRRKRLALADLYRSEGVYRYERGFNLRAVAALAAGMLAALSGKLVPALAGTFTYAWLIGFAVAFALYWALMRAGTAKPSGSPDSLPAAEHA